MGDDCVDATYGFVEENSIKHISIMYSQSAQKADILRVVESWVIWS
jgi:hypothetical protein